jgi:hypothetical protein
MKAFSASVDCSARGIFCLVSRVANAHAEQTYESYDAFYAARPGAVSGVFYLPASAFTSDAPFGFAIEDKN